MRRLLLILLLVPIALCAAEQSQGPDGSASTNPHNLLFVLPESIPYHYLDTESGQVVGTLIDQFDDLLSNAGLGYPDYEIYSWKRALSIANSRAATLIMPLSRTPEREEQYHWLKLLRETRFSIFSLQPEPLTPEIITQQGITIYSENGGIQCDLLIDAGVPERLVSRFEGISHDKVVDLAIAGRIKYFIAEEDLVQVGLAERGLEQSSLNITYTIDQTVKDYLAMASDNDETLVKALIAALNQEN